ncbi:MAG TPA: hypothetical protein VH142_27280, partial [Polyangiaceae bacterium]|nr:hypothetical protein [Polyangiaceae bacterium]
MPPPTAGPSPPVAPPPPPSDPQPAPDGEAASGDDESNAADSNGSTDEGAAPAPTTTDSVEINPGVFWTPRALVTLGFPEKIIPLYIAGKVTRASTNPLEAWEVRGDVIVLNQAFRGVARFVDHSYASAAVSLDSSLIAKLLCLGGASGAISVEYDVADRTLRLRGDVTASPSSVATCLAERYLGDAG